MANVKTRLGYNPLLVPFYEARQLSYLHKIRKRVFSQILKQVWSLNIDALTARQSLHDKMSFITHKICTSMCIHLHIETKHCI